MSLSLSPEDGPFVFGAYAAHLDRVTESVPLAPPAQAAPVDPSPAARASDSDDQIDQVAC
jgi:hypothetical protein